MKDDYAIVKRLKTGEVLPAGSVPVDLIRTATGDTVLQLINADTGATSTLTIPSVTDESSDLAAGKVALSADFSIAATQSMLVMCLSGGTLINLELRLQ